MAERVDAREPSPRPERVGVLGGTFDPPHVAHLDLATAARRQFDLDRVLFVVAGDPWQKAEHVVAGARARLAMVEAALEGRDGFEACALEVERPGPSYMASTLAELSAHGRELFLIVGADVAGGLGTWHDPDRVKAAATILVADRPGSGVEAAAAVAALREAGWDCAPVDLPPHDVSSTGVRARLAAGETTGGDLPADVVRVVEERGLYTRP